MRFRGMMAMAVLASASVPAAAQTTIEAAKPATIVTALQNAGYKAVLDKDNDGEPKITSAANGAKFTVFFYGCEQHIACKSIQFYAGYTMKAKPTQQKINEWNANNRFATGFIDKDGDPNIEWDVVTEGGLSATLFAGVTDRWTTAMGSFQTFVGFS